MKMEIKEWSPSMTARGSYFFPTVKFVGVIYDDDGNFLAETGKCTTKRGARMACHRKMEAL